MSLSGRTRGTLIEVTADAYTHDELDVLFLRLGLEHDYQLEQTQGRTKLRRVRRAVELLEAENRVVDLAREIVEVKFAGSSYGRTNAPPDVLVDSLRLDGLEVIDGSLVVVTPEPADLGREMSLVESLLEEQGFDVALSHYQQAVASYVDGRLEASNGQLRSCLEGLLLEICHRVTGQRASDPRGAIERLRSHGAIDGDEARLLTGLAGISNERGAHQGLTDREEALFRLHVTSAVARYLLMRISG